MARTATIAAFICAEFAPDISPAELAVDYDLLANGVVDSLALLKIIAWLETEFAVAVDDVELDPDSFRSVGAIDAFVGRVQPAGVA